MSDTDTGTETAGGERHATWIELFFDLVAVAGIAALSHVLIGHLTWTSIGLYALLFVAFWAAWAAFMLYGNVGGNTVHVIQVLVGMFGIGVMSSAIPGVAHWVQGEADGDHVARAAHVFALAYFLTRIAASKAFGNRLVVDLPSVQQTAGTLPWLASVFVDRLSVVIVLWCVGIAIDLLGIVAMSGERAEQQVEQRMAQRAGRAARSRGAQDERLSRRLDRFRIQMVSVSGEHFGERLGLFVIIVLGEGVVQIVDAAAESPLDRTAAWAGLVTFALLATVFVLALMTGHAGVPGIGPDDLAPRYLLLLHALTTGTITALAVGLAQVIELGHEPAPDGVRWLVCGAVALYLLTGLVAALVTHSVAIIPALGWLTAGVVVPLLLAAVEVDASATLTTAILLASALVTLSLTRRASAAGDSASG